jgi:hypothetical protein
MIMISALYQTNKLSWILIIIVQAGRHVAPIEHINLNQPVFAIYH